MAVCHVSENPLQNVSPWRDDTVAILVDLNKDFGGPKCPLGNWTNFHANASFFFFFSSSRCDQMLRSFSQCHASIIWGKKFGGYRHLKTIDISAPKLVPTPIPEVAAGKGRLQPRSSSLKPFALVPLRDRRLSFSCAFCLTGVDVEGRKRRCGTRVVGRRRIGVRVRARRQ